MEYTKQYESNILKTVCPFSTLNYNYKTNICVALNHCNDIFSFILNKPWNLD